MTYHSTYFGHNIYRKTTFGPQLRWNSRAPNGRSLAADTLSGLKHIIRNSTLHG